MRVERGLVEKKADAELVNSVGKSGGGVESPSRRSRRRHKKPSSTMPTAIMRLFRACREVFSNGGAGIVPSPEEVDRIRTVLDKLKPTDVNLSPNMPYFKNVETQNGKSPVIYLHLYECDKFSIGIFCLPPSSVIPLHNHPGMTVFSKILFGSMHIKSYDWADVPEDHENSVDDSSHSRPPGVRLAKVKTDAVFKAPCNTSILYPAAGGNMHRFTAVTACAVLDVLGPPYSDPEGRHCTYYNVHPYESFAGELDKPPPDGEYEWLEAREKPDDFHVLGAKYTGPKIVADR